MKTFKPFFLLVLGSLQLGWQVIRYALIFVSAFFRQRASLGCELVAIRSQLSFYKESIRQKKQPRPHFIPAFRLVWVWLSTVWSGWKTAAALMKPKTVLQWHDSAFRQWWRWKSRRKGGRPTISPEMRGLIRRLSRENVLWSAETIHGHLVLLGFDPPCPDTIRKYMIKPPGGSRGKSQHWLTFLRNHLPVSWAMDFFTVPTATFRVLYLLFVIEHGRRRIVHFNVTDHLTEENANNEGGHAEPRTHIHEGSGYKRPADDIADHFWCVGALWNITRRDSRSPRRPRRLSRALAQRAEGRQARDLLRRPAHAQRAADFLNSLQPQESAASGEGRFGPASGFFRAPPWPRPAVMDLYHSRPGSALRRVTEPELIELSLRRYFHSQYFVVMLSFASLSCS